MTAKRSLRLILILVVLFACLASPRSAAAGSGSPCGPTYVVQPGDWLIKIANRCGVTLADLYAANPGVAWQRYIYPGQVLNIPDGSGYIYPAPPPYTPPYTPPYQPPYMPPYTPPITGPAFPSPASMSVAPHVGGVYYGTTGRVGTSLVLQVTVRNTGTVALEVVANLTLPSGMDLLEVYNDCPASLSPGSACNFNWQFIPRVSQRVYVRVYVRGLYGTERITQSPAYLFDISD